MRTLTIKQWEKRQDKFAKDRTIKRQTYAEYLTLIKQRKEVLEYFEKWEVERRKEGIFVLHKNFKGPEWTELRVYVYNSGFNDFYKYYLEEYGNSNTMSRLGDTNSLYDNRNYQILLNGLVKYLRNKEGLK